MGLSSIKVLYRSPDSLTLWGIPYHMRPGQQPRDLWNGRTFPVIREGWYGLTAPAPGPREGWVYLGEPGWYCGPTEEHERIKAFLEPLRAAGLVPGGPHEWCTLP